MIFFMGKKFSECLNFEFAGVYFLRNLYIWTNRKYKYYPRRKIMLNEEHKASTATGVEARMTLRVFGCQLLTRLKAGYRLMLRAVVHKGALYIRHK